jgi:diguanylate cyclase (GGDEF)-like protein
MRKRLSRIKHWVARHGGGSTLVGARAMIVLYGALITLGALTSLSVLIEPDWQQHADVLIAGLAACALAATAVGWLVIRGTTVKESDLVLATSCGMWGIFLLLTVSVTGSTDAIWLAPILLLAALALHTLSFTIVFLQFAAIMLVAPWLHETGDPVGETMSVIAAGGTLCIFARYTGLYLRTTLDELDHAGRHDSLTGLLNRHGMELEWDRSGDRGGFLVLCDIDHFKKVNDSHGHAVGDEVLRVTAAAIDAQPGCDLATRHGGEEFLFRVPSTLEVDLVVERCRAVATHLAGSRFAHVDGRPITLSFGIAAQADGLELDELLKVADEAMYRSKNAGRNRISWHRSGEALEAVQLPAADSRVTAVPHLRRPA